MNRLTGFLTLLVICFVLPSLLPADPGTAFTYQGRLADGSTPIEVAVDLQFSLWDSSTTGSQVGAAVQVLNQAYDGGIVQQDLDFGIGAFNGDPRWLQIELANPAGSALTTLTPRIQMLPAPYAIYAESSGSVAGDADPDPTNELNTGLTLNGMNLQLTDAGGTLQADLSPLAGTVFGDRHSLDAVDGNPTDVVFVDDQGAVGVGTTDPLAGLHVTNSVLQSSLSLLGSVRDNQATTNALNLARALAVSGNYAYVGTAAEGLSVFDISDPTNPVQVAVADSSNGFAILADIQDIVIDGTRAYVVALNTDALVILDISNPLSPSILGVAQDGDGTFTRMNGAFSVHVEGNTAYVVTVIEDFLTVIDVTNPASLQQLSITPIPTGAADSFRGIDVVGSRAYITNAFIRTLTVVDVSDPITPVVLGSVANGQNGVNALNNPRGIDVVGNIAYIAAFVSDSLAILDVTDPTNITQLGSVRRTDGFPNLDGAIDVLAVGDILYLCSFGDAVFAFDVSNPTNPSVLDIAIDGQNGVTTVNGAARLAFQGGNIYVASAGDDSLTIFNTTTAEVGMRVGVGSFFEGQILDNSGDPGAAGQLLSSTATGVDWIDAPVDGDSDATNEIQTLSFSAPNLSISGAGGNSVDLSTLSPGLSQVLATDGNAGGDNAFNFSSIAINSFSDAGARLRVSGGDALIDRGGTANSLGRNVTIGGARTGNAEFASLQFQNFDQNSGGVDYVGAAIRSNNELSSDSGNLRFLTKGAGTLNERVVIDTSGMVGIGEGSPDYPLHIGSAGTAVNSYTSATASQQARIQLFVNEANETGGGIAISDEGGFFDLNDGYITYLPLSAGQGVRIQGEFRVLDLAWPDYVFEEDYELKSLEEVEAHIDEHGHLPGVPSAAEVDAEGADLGEMNTILLRKIEEMTLHQIEMMKTIKRLEQEVDSLKTSQQNQ
jgi:hypothetical protein